MISLKIRVFVLPGLANVPARKVRRIIFSTTMGSVANKI